MIQLIHLHLQASLPSPEPPQPLPPLVKSSVPVPTPERISKIPPLNQQPSVKRKSRSVARKKTVVVRERRRQKKRASEPSLKSRTDRSIAKLFKCTWFLENILGGTGKLSDADLEMFAVGGLAVGRIINISKIPWTEITQPKTSLGDKETQIFQRFRSKFVSGNNNSLHVPSLASSQPYKPIKVIKTYGRKPRVTEKTKVSDEKFEKINFIPPCLSTLVGYRGLLARAADIDPDGQSGERSLELRGEHRVADELLVRRFLQVFLWPALMATVPPPKQETVFTDSEGDDDIIVLD